MKPEIEAPEQAGRQIANNHIMRAIIDLLAEALERPSEDIRRDIKTRVDHSTALLRLQSAGRQDQRAALYAMDHTFSWVLGDRETETRQ